MCMASKLYKSCFLVDVLIAYMATMNNNLLIGENKGSCQVKTKPKIREKSGLARPQQPTRIHLFWKHVQKSHKNTQMLFLD